MRTMYDSVTPTNIPTNAEMVAGYIDKELYRWTQRDWDRFPHAVKVRIARLATTNDGHVLDVEDRLATPAQAPGWIRMRRAAGADPTIYCNRSTWPQVNAACDAAGVARPHYWIATGTRQAVIPAGAVAAQHTLDFKPAGFPGTVDISIVADYWPGVDSAQEEDVALTNDDLLKFWYQYPVSTIDGQSLNAGQLIESTFLKVGAISDALAVLLEKATDDPGITADFIKQTINEAVVNHISITGELHVGPVEG
jgi:hypothetical protein